MDASSTGSIKLLIYVCSPTVVETSDVFRKGVLTRFKRFGVDTRPVRLAVLTRFNRFGVDTRPMRFAVETRFNKFGVLTNPRRFAVDTYPACPKFATVEASAF